MKKTILNSLTVVTLFFASAANAQVGVGVPAGDIHPSAELEVKSTTKGFLPPRMTNAERNSIATPATGLLIYQTDAVANNPAGLYFYDGITWKNGIGAQGEVGPKGDKGDVGATGPQGEIGPAGEQGLPSFVYANAYPYPPSIKTGFSVAGSKTYCTTYSLPATITFSEASVVHNNHGGSDTYRIAIYRGDLTNGVLVGQTIIDISRSPYDTKSLTEAPGQSLSFTAGSQVSVCYSVSGTTTSPAIYNSGVYNIALGMMSISKITGGFPTNISTITGPGATATSTRICMDLK